jgi:DNA-binding transcriptional MerR regulator
VANKPIRIEFVAEVAQYLRDTKKLEVSTEDIGDALNAVTKDSEDLERKLSKAIRAAERDVGSLERVIDELPKSTSKAAREADKDFRKFGDDARDAGKEAGQNLGQSLGEGLSSGDLSDVLQEVLGETLGNISGPASAAVAVGAGIALAVWNAFAEASRVEKQKLNEILDITDETTGALDRVAQLRLAFEELGDGDYGQGLKDAKKYADILGLSMADISNLISGDLNPKAQATKALLEAQAALIEHTAQNEMRDLTAEEMKRLDAIRQILGTTALQVTAVQQGAEAQGTWNAAQKTAVENTQAMAEYMQASAEAAAGVPGALEEAQKWAEYLAWYSRAAEQSLKNARDYAAGTGGRLPVVGTGQKAAI